MLMHSGFFADNGGKKLYAKLKNEFLKPVFTRYF